MKQIKLLIWLFAAFSGTAFVYANLDGPPPGYTGAPGEPSCTVTGCHDVPSGRFVGARMDNTGPQHVDTVAYRLLLDAGAGMYGEEWGFQLTVLDSLDQPFGEIVVSDSVRTRLIQGNDGKTYLSHTAAGVPSGVSQVTAWAFLWVRPSGAAITDVIRFYVAGLLADGDGTPANDAVVTRMAVGPFCPVGLTGDVNVNGHVTSQDIIWLVNYCFKGGPGPEVCTATGDVNCDAWINAADIIYLVNHVFRGGTPPCDVCQLIIDGTWDC